MFLIDKLPARIYIGNEGEENATQVRFDVSAWDALYPDAVYSITYVRPGETIVYPEVPSHVVHADGVLTWAPSKSVLDISDYGTLVIHCTEDDVKKKSAMTMFFVARSHPSSGAAPDPIADWIDDATSKLAEVDHFVDETIDAAEAANAAALRAENGEDARERAEGLRVIAEQGRHDAYVIAEEARDGLYESAEIARDELFESAETTRNTQSGEATDRANAIAGTLEGIAPLWSDVDISVSALGEGVAPTASITQGETGTSISLGIPKGDTGAKGDKGNDGKPFNYRGDYNPDADPLYTKNDVVRFGGGGFVYISDVDSNEPTSSASHWQQIASMGGQDLVDAAVAARDAAQGHRDAAAGYAAQLAAGTASPAGTYANLAALIAADPDHTKIYITLDDGKWCYWNGSAWVAGGVYQAIINADIPFADSAYNIAGVTVGAALTELGQKQAPLATQQTINLFNIYNTTYSGYRVPATINNVTLEPTLDVPNANYTLTKAIPVEKSTKYYIPVAAVVGIAQFSQAGARIGYLAPTNSPDGVSKHFTTSSTTRWIVIDFFYTYNYQQFMLIEETDNFVYPSSFVEYGFSFVENIQLLEKNIKDLQTYTEASPNIYDPDMTFYDNYVVYTNDVAIDPETLEITGLSADDKYITSSAIPVSGSTSYAIDSRFSGIIRAFNSVGVKIGDLQGALNDGTNCKYFTTTSSARFVIFSFHKPTFSGYADMMMIAGTALPLYQYPYGDILDPDIKVLAENVSGFEFPTIEASSKALDDDEIDDLKELAQKIQDKQSYETLTFACMSDTHYSTDNSETTKRSTALALGKLTDYCGLDFIANLGDMLTYGRTKTEAKGDLFTLADYTNANAKKTPVLFVKGNHDDNSYLTKLDSGQYGTDEVLNDSEFFARTIAFSVRNRNVVVDPLHPDDGYYYFDDEKSKIRTFVLNSTNLPYDIIDGSDYRYAGYRGHAFSNAQLNFVADALLFSDKTTPSDWAALVLVHVPIETTNTDGKRFGGLDASIRNAAQMLGIIDAYISGTAYTSTGDGWRVSHGDTEGDFVYSIDVDYQSKGAGEFIAMVSGHTHTDNTSAAIGDLITDPSYGLRYIGVSASGFSAFAVNRTGRTIDIFKYGTPVVENGAATHPTAIGLPFDGSTLVYDYTVTY